MTRVKDKPLGAKAFGKIPHLPGSKTGQADRTAPPGLARRCTAAAAPGDVVLVQEKLDGSCVAIAKLAEGVVALGREGWRAAESDNEGRRRFAQWVTAHRDRFDALLEPGEWLVGEWLALVHGTRYRLTHEPFVAFDLLAEGRPPLTLATLTERLAGRCALPALLHQGPPLSVAQADALLGEHGRHGAIDAAEGAVWRLEQRGRLVARAKYVRPTKRAGAYLPEHTGQPALWNWEAP